jgi:hypothetical protein
MNSTFMTISTEAPSTSTFGTKIAPLLLLKHGKKLSNPNNNFSYFHPGNLTLSTSVTIHVTPEHYYLTSWLCLWILFVLAIFFGAYQSHKENQWLMAAQKASQSLGRGGGVGGVGDEEGVVVTNASNTVDDLEQQQHHQQRTGAAVTRGIANDMPAVSGSGIGVGGSNRRGKFGLVGETRISTGGTTMVGVGSGGNGSDREAISSGDMSRTMVCDCDCVSMLSLLYHYFWYLSLFLFYCFFLIKYLLLLLLLHLCMRAVSTSSFVGHDGPNDCTPNSNL